MLGKQSEDDQDANSKLCGRRDNRFRRTKVCKKGPEDDKEAKRRHKGAKKESKRSYRRDGSFSQVDGG